MREMHWYVLAEDLNGKRIEEYDIFDHDGFADDVRKAYRKHHDDVDAFADKVHGSLFYYFNSKCEWEVIVSAWPPSDRIPDKKIDVYEQVMLNWDVFIDYVWRQAHARKSRNNTKNGKVLP